MKPEAVNIVVLVTSVSLEEANKIASLLLTERKAACINIVPEINSMFWWKGRIETTRESLLIIKTIAELLQDIVETVKKYHSYEVPEIIALPIVGGNVDYLQWITKEVEAAKK